MFTPVKIEQRTKLQSFYYGIKMNIIEWKLNELFEERKFDISIFGSPKVVDSKYGKAIHFKGIDDGIVFKQNPIIG